MTTEILGVGAITIICYLFAEGVKASKLNNKWIPLFAGLLGGILGIVGLYIMPEFPASDILTAISVGISSGLAATGANQVYKQLSAKPVPVYDDDDDDFGGITD